MPQSPKSAILALCAALLAAVAGAQDKIYTGQGATHAGRIVKVDDTGVWIDMSGAQSKFNRSDVARVEVPIPVEADEGLRLYKNRDYAGAVAKLEPVMAKYEGLPQPWIEEAGYTLAKCYLQAGNYAKAQQMFARTEKFFPDSTNGMASTAGKARAHLGLREYDKAIALLEPVVAEKEKNISLTDAEMMELGNACLTLGECYYSMGEKEKGLSYFLKVTVLYPLHAPDYAEALYRSGIAFEEMNDLPRAVRQYKDFLKADAGSPLAGDAKSRLQKLETKLPKQSG